MNFALNWVALLLGTLAIFFVNAIWFGPKTFYPAWWKALGKEMPKPGELRVRCYCRRCILGSPTIRPAGLQGVDHRGRR